MNEIIEVPSSCYLCGRLLDSNPTEDHIIPNKLFRSEDQNRPKLPVHDKCNNDKSIDDEWFMKQLQIYSSLNPDAETEVSKLIEKAIEEKPNAYIIGKNVRNYKFARGIFDKFEWGMEFKHNNKSLIQIKLDKKAVDRFDAYIKTLCRGLYLYNLPTSRPSVPRILIQQYALLDIRNKTPGFIDPIQKLISYSPDTRFGQMWGDRLLYIGNRVGETQDKGFIFVQFYSQIGVLATFQ